MPTNRKKHYHMCIYIYIYISHFSRAIWLIFPSSHVRSCKVSANQLHRSVKRKHRPSRQRRARQSQIRWCPTPGWVARGKKLEDIRSTTDHEIKASHFSRAIWLIFPSSHVRSCKVSANQLHRSVRRKHRPSRQRRARKSQIRWCPTPLLGPCAASKRARLMHSGIKNFIASCIEQFDLVSSSQRQSVDKNLSCHFLQIIF